MTKNVLFVVFTAAVLLFNACNSGSKMPSPAFNDVLINLSADVKDVVQRAAAADFPNAAAGAAQVAVIARKSAAPDWSELYINHKFADVGSAAAGYSLSWATGNEQYWPSNGDGLTFAAYSPVAAGGAGLSLDVALGSATPDVIVATTKDGITPITGRKDGASQSPPSVNFHFKHILSQLQVKINNATDDLDVTKVEIAVAVDECVKSYEITSGVWTPGTAPAEVRTYSYSKAAGYGGGTAEVVNSVPVLLFPGTQASVTIKLYAGQNEELFAGKTVDEFKDSGQVAASLVAGMKTILTLKIAGTEIEGMTASVEDWEVLGEYEVVVK